MQLTEDAIFEAALQLDLPSINKFCLTDRRINSIICDNQHFWHKLFVKTYGVDYPGYNDWKYIYQHYRSYFVDFKEESDIKVLKAYITKFITIILDIHNNLWIKGSRALPMFNISVENYDDGYVKVEGIKAKDFVYFHYNTYIIDMEDNLHRITRGTRKLVAHNVKQVDVSVNYSYYIDNNNTLYDLKSSTPIMENIRYVTSTNRSSYIIDTENNVYSVGSNTFGQLGLGDLENRDEYTLIPGIKADKISATVGTVMILDLDGNVWVFGISTQEGLGLGETRSIKIPTMIEGIKGKKILIDGSSAYIVDLHNRLWRVGYNTLIKTPRVGVVNQFTLVEGYEVFDVFPGKIVSFTGNKL